MSAMASPFLFKAFAFFGHHIHPALLHLVPPASAETAAAAAAKTTQEDLREEQQSRGLPERDQRQMKDHGHQRIPKREYDKAEDRNTGHGDKKEDKEFRS